MFYTDFEGSQQVHEDDVCSHCFGTGGAIGSGYEGSGEPCHSGPYFSYEIPEEVIPNPQPQLSPSEFDADKWGCPRCDWPLDPADDMGDGGVTCACGAWVPLPDPPNQIPA